MEPGPVSIQSRAASPTPTQPTGLLGAELARLRQKPAVDLQFKTRRQSTENCLATVLIYVCLSSGDPDCGEQDMYFYAYMGL